MQPSENAPSRLGVGTDNAASVPVDSVLDILRAVHLAESEADVVRVGAEYAQRWSNVALSGPFAIRSGATIGNPSTIGGQAASRGPVTEDERRSMAMTGRFATSFPLWAPAAERIELLAVAVTDTWPTAEERLLLELVVRVIDLRLASVHSDRSLRQSEAEARRLEAQAQSESEHMRWLVDTATSSSSIRDVVQALSVKTHRTVVLRDGTGRPIVTGYADGKLVPANPRPITIHLAGTRNVLPVPTRWKNHLSVLVEPSVGDRMLLTLIEPEKEAGPGTSDPQTVTALQLAALMLRELIDRLQSPGESEDRIERLLVEELIGGTDAAHAEVRADLLGLDLSKQSRAAVAKYSSARSSADKVATLIRQAIRQLGSRVLVAPVRDKLILVGPADRSLWDRLRDAVLTEQFIFHFSLALGRVAASPADLPHSYLDAEDVLRIKASLPHGRDVIAVEDLGVLRFFAHEPSVWEYIQQWLGALISYDAGRSSNLVETLRTFLETGGHYDQTANALILHRSTLRYRLRRIRLITGLDLADPETRFNLELATRALKVLNALQSDQSPVEPAEVAAIEDPVPPVEIDQDVAVQPARSLD
jgi:DNA-binding PucR family transcriptional regulator